MKRLLLATISAIVLSATLAMANTFMVSTPAGSTTSGGSVNAQAVITTGLNSVTIDLTNLLTAAQMGNVAQALSDLSFTLSGAFATGLVSDTNRSYTGKLVDVAKGGAVTTDAGNGVAASYNGWDFSNTLSTFLLEDLGSAAGPAQLILGGTTSTASYPSANASIAGNGPHNPFLQQDAVFTLSVTGVTAATNVTAGSLSFGTTLGTDIITGVVTPQAIPEPRFVSLLLFSGLLLVTIYYRRRASVR